jgi:hypothetical protein
MNNIKETLTNDLKKYFYNFFTNKILNNLCNKYNLNYNEVINYLKNELLFMNQPCYNINNDLSIICNNYNIKSKIKYKTEDFGKKFEMAICLLYNIEYDGIYKYELNEASILKNRISKLKDIIPYKLKHIASGGCPHDFEIFTSETNCIKYLSAKTCKLGINNSKKNGKIAPQIIGQASKKKFCEYFCEYLNIDKNYNIEQIKELIILNIDCLLHHYTINTFISPIIYYNETRDILYFIKINKEIYWNKENITFTHIIKNKKWNESSSVKINNNSIGEFQIHNNRDNIKFRWNFENLLKVYKNHFDISIL